MPSEYDLIILGSGSTAFAAALRASSYGARILMLEKSVLGGTCINWGCIPSKTLIHAALFRHDAVLGTAIGLNLVAGSVDYERLSAHRDQVVQGLRKERYLDVLQNIPDLELVKETGRFIDSNTITTGDRTYRSKRILVAVGGLPRIIPLKGLEQCDYLTSRTALLLRRLPASLIIVGGGVIAVEMGQMFHRLGCRVTILENGPRLLPSVEQEPALALQEALTAEGLRIIPNAHICSVEARGDVSLVHAELDGIQHEFNAEKLLLAVGTAPATDGIGLEKTGVGLDRQGFIITDGRMRSTEAGIWAAGDVTGKLMIASAGARQGVVAVDDMFNQECGCTMNYLNIPMAIFTDPEVAFVGHTEESARQAGFTVMVNILAVSSIPKARVTGHNSGCIKMIADRISGRLLGVHLVCHRGADLINEAALALQLKATVEDLATTLHVYPSMSEGLRLCAQGFSRDVSRLSCCAE